MPRSRLPPAVDPDERAALRKKGERKWSNKTMSRDIRLAALTSFNFMGSVLYLNKIAKSNPTAYLNFIARCLIREDGADMGGTTFIVQQLNVSAAPVPGVINSPVLEHVSPVRLVANGGEVIDVESSDG